MPHDSPAAKVIRLLGASEIAAACDLTTSAVYKWKANSGRVPAEHQPRVLDLAIRKGKPLTAAEIIGVIA